MNVANNHIEILPPSIGLMRSLKHLYVQNNKLEGLPETLGNDQLLLTLNASDNVITELLGDLRKWRTMEVLLLARNEISQIPKSFKHLSNLHTFDVTDNQIVTASLPDGAGKVLKICNLAGNPWRLPKPGEEDKRSLITKLHR